LDEVEQNIVFWQIIDLQDTVKSCYVVLPEFNIHSITKFVLNHSLTAQGSGLPFFIQELGYSYAWAEYYLQQNAFRRHYAWADHYSSDVIYRSCGGLWANEKEGKIHRMPCDCLPRGWNGANLLMQAANHNIPTWSLDTLLCVLILGTNVNIRT